MALKSAYDSKTEIPPTLADHYSEVEGKWVLNLDGEHPSFVKRDEFKTTQARINEFREGNVALKKERDELSAKLEDINAKLAGFEGVDPEEYKRLKETAATIEKKGGKASVEGIEELITKAVAPLSGQVSKLQEALKEQQEAAKRAGEQLESERFRGDLSKIAAEAGVRSESLDYVLWKMQQEGFARDNGQIVLKKDGVPRYSEADPTKPYSPSEFLDGLKSKESHLFKASSGSGSSGGGAPSLNGKKVLLNPTPKEMGIHADDIAAGKMIVQRT